ncbi:myb-like DNA-binding domain-containing protein [Colletotrichum tofieldiae]|uniref:Myb-like DNA-binding domain-containing protein n=1 Tax=Colletotrichum tofieldiae TaxID=708197 RepID=A0A166U0K0_9PEZI|nr:myb-like DNA-binding domain-containing protein [Colletotrichum tofieldiae]GKT64120.1 MYB-like DNA-binding domain-containing protein [Colletotrichum tofieldiae]GKT71912.1 myb-like DNA-binding domain-containing protein [Colletotrichum tofieldiae]
MFSSISRIFTGQTPSKNSSPGPARPDFEDNIARTFPSTAPAEYPDGIDDRQLAGMASQDWGQDTVLDLPASSDNDEAPDEVHDGITDYVDPFSSMQPFSTQAVPDEDVIAPTYASSEDEAVRKKKAKKGKKTDEKKARAKKGKNKRKSSDLEHSELALPTPTTSGPTSHSAAEEAIMSNGEANDDESASANQQKKKRKRKSGNSIESNEAQDSSRKKKKKKRRTALEDIEDADMEPQPQESVPESPVNTAANDTGVPSPAYERDPALDSTLKSEPQRSQLLGVSRQLFSKPSGTPAVDASDDENPVSMSSPSVAAQRRRSMSRGSQISVLRQSLAREVASQPGKISEAVESAHEASPERGGSAVDSDVGSFADNLPPSSQPPREDTPSSNDADAEVTEEPQLPIRTFRDTLNNLASKDTGRKKPTATPRATRRRNVEANPDISEAGNLPSSAQKSTRSTVTKRQRSKPDFFEKPPLDENAGEGHEATENQDAADTQNPEENLAALSELPSADVAEPLKKQKKTRKSAASRASTAADTATPKTKAVKKPVTQKGQFLTGQFSIEEMRNLTQAVEKYRDDHNLSQKEVNDLIQMRNRKKTGASKGSKGLQFDGQQFLDMWAVICAAVPTRRRQKVIDVARQEFHNFKARGGGWTPKDDAKLEELHTKYNGSWVKIADEMSRHPNDLRDRYRNYVVCGGIEGRKKWSEEEERELVEHVVTSLRRIDKLPGNRHKSPLSLINWQSISELMGHRRSRLQCAKKFKTLNVEVGPRDVLKSSQPASTVTWLLEKARKQIQEMSPEDKYELVHSILAGAAGRDQDIRWSKLVDLQFRRKWPKPTLQLLWHRLKQQVPDYERKPVRDCARWLLEDAETNAPRDGRFLDGGYTDGDSEDELLVVDPPKKTPGRRGKKRKNRSEETVVDSGGSDNDETRLTNFDSPSAQQQPSSAASQRSTPLLAYSPEDSPRASSSSLPAATQHRTRLAPVETEGTKPSPTKKRVRLSGGKSARHRSMEEDGGSPEPMASQYAAEDIPDRLKEKKEATRRRISSGSRLRSAASLQPESVQNSDVDEDMPPIHVPPSTQPLSRKRSMFKLSQGNWARKTGASVLPGESVESTDKSLSELEAASGQNSQAENDTPAKPRETKRRRKNTEVAESPA